MTRTACLVLIVLVFLALAVVSPFSCICHYRRRSRTAVNPGIQYTSSQSIQRECQRLNVRTYQ
jgi:hypothetical protein